MTRSGQRATRGRPEGCSRRPVGGSEQPGGGLTATRGRPKGGSGWPENGTRAARGRLEGGRGQPEWPCRGYGLKIWRAGRHNTLRHVRAEPSQASTGLASARSPDCDRGPVGPRSVRPLEQEDHGAPAQRGTALSNYAVIRHRYRSC